ncbi:MAG: hypothetical protein ACTSRS_01385 [Candidatus Helarchaeota archaeon]
MIVDVKTQENIVLKDLDDFNPEFQSKKTLTSFFQKREIMKLPPSAKFILYLLKFRGPLNRKRIIQETMMPDRTVGFALKMLLEKQLIKKEEPDYSPNKFSGGRRKRRKRDRRITNYNLVQTLLPFEMLDF